MLPILVQGCSFSDTNVSEHPLDVEPVFITDQTGVEWDITTAVHKYGFEASRFEHGAGADAIQPIIEPSMIGPGERGYPVDDATFDVIAISINGEARAYGWFDILRNEVVDEVFGEVPVAVSY